MTTLTILSQLLPLIVVLLSAGVTVFAHLRKWTIPESAATPDEPPPPAAEKRVPFLTRYRWEIILAAAVALILLFAVLFAPPRLTWAISAGKASSPTLLCERQIQNYIWLEAEEIPLGIGWQIEINFAQGWSGSGFVMDGYGSQFLLSYFPSPFLRREIYVWTRPTSAWWTIRPHI